MALDEQERRELSNITKAREKLEAGTYGVCEICRKKINLERLTALPMVRLCISCQKQMEEAARP
jgi:DnaK suppressor protein